MMAAMKPERRAHVPLGPGVGMVLAVLCLVVFGPVLFAGLLMPGGRALLAFPAALLVMLVCLYLRLPRGERHATERGGGAVKSLRAMAVVFQRYSQRFGFDPLLVAAILACTAWPLVLVALG